MGVKGELFTPFAPWHSTVIYFLRGRLHTQQRFLFQHSFYDSVVGGFGLSISDWFRAGGTSLNEQLTGTAGSPLTLYTCTVRCKP